MLVCGCDRILKSEKSMNIKYNHIYGVDIEVSMSHYDIVFTKVESVEAGSGIQGGLHDSEGETLITILRHSSFVFNLSKPVYPSYLAEKLSLTVEEAEYLIEYFSLGEHPGIGFEKEANQIAAELLMPEFAVRSKVEEEGMGVEKMATHFGVPESVMAMRLKGLGYNVLEEL
jgi:hypothetical protein